MNPAKIFYSYAHEDEQYRKDISSYLGVLRLNNKIDEWYDREISPGVNYHVEINTNIENADIIIFLISKDFLNSEYCFGIESTKAFTLQKQGTLQIVPVLINPCLFKESRFSQLQIIPRNALPISVSPSKEIAFNEVAEEIRDIVNKILETKTVNPVIKNEYEYSLSLNIIRQQITSFAQLYERIRQLMEPGNDRTAKMQAIFNKMKAIANACYPFLEEFSKSPLPGERLAAVSILQNFASEDYFSFLAETIGSEKPFIGYQAALAVRFAVDAMTPKTYDSLSKTIALAKEKLIQANVSTGSDRFKELQNAENELTSNMKNST